MCTKLQTQWQSLTKSLIILTQSLSSSHMRAFHTFHGMAWQCTRRPNGGMRIHCVRRLGLLPCQDRGRVGPTATALIDSSTISPPKYRRRSTKWVACSNDRASTNADVPPVPLLYGAVGTRISAAEIIWCFGFTMWQQKTCSRHAGKRRIERLVTWP